MSVMGVSNFVPAFDLLLILGFHVFGAPTEVPDAGSDRGRWRRRDFVEENPRFLRPHAVPLAREFSFFAIEFGRVEIDRGGGFGRVQVDVMKVRRRHLGEAGEGQRQIRH